MAQLIALRSFRYGSRELRAGDEFTVPDALARFYCTVGRARRCVYGLPETAARLEPAAVTEEPPAPARRRRTYKRRDMVAED